MLSPSNKTEFLQHLETGGLYRAVALAVLESGVDPGDGSALTELVASLEVTTAGGRVELGGRDVTAELRSEQVGAMSSRVSAVPDVRAALLDLQRNWVTRDSPGAVVEGRDIGTVVFPDSPVKVFLTARPEVRAQRRVDDLGLHRDEVPRVARELAERDERDSTRAVAPLRPAADATVIDTSDLSIDEVIEAVMRAVAAR